jgi:prepilin-type N-terminal cleavage/methylation domain-containing protein
MILYSYLVSPDKMRRGFWRAVRGFSLLEIVLVLFVLGIMAAALSPSVGDVIGGSRRDSEQRTLGEIARSIEQSFDATDLTAVNIAAMPGTIGGSDTATTFSSSTSAPYGAVANTDWYAKVARVRGISPLVGNPPTPAIQPEVSRIAYNALRNPRLLFAAPAEAGRQRFLLVSLMATPEQLTLPAYEGNAAWFDAIWNQDWDSRTAAVPAYWNGRLTAAQLAQWSQGAAGLTQAHKLCVRKIVLPKYRVTVNNNHATEAAFISFNNVSNAQQAAANSGANTTPEILAGRLITINRGAAWPGVEALRFHLRENSTVTVQ